MLLVVELFVLVLVLQDALLFVLLFVLIAAEANVEELVKQNVQMDVVQPVAPNAVMAVVVVVEHRVHLLAQKNVVVYVQKLVHQLV